GLDLGGDGPDEVAWAIVAEILALKNSRAGGFLRDRKGPIHERPKSEEAVTSGRSCRQAGTNERRPSAGSSWPPAPRLAWAGQSSSSTSRAGPCCGGC